MWMTVSRCLDDRGFSLQANRKAKEGPQHANRDAQFRYIKWAAAQQKRYERGEWATYAQW
jgi:hypothetical protein